MRDFFETEINDTYRRIDGLFKIKIAAQLNGSGLFFTKFIDSVPYRLIINDQYVVDFTYLKTLLESLINIISNEIKQNEAEVEAFENRKYNDFKADDYTIDDNLELNSNRLYKLEKLKTRINILLERIAAN